VNELPLIEVQELPDCQWVAKLERAVSAPPKFERWYQEREGLINLSQDDFARIYLGEFKPIEPCRAYDLQD